MDPITNVIAREGPPTNDPVDRGGRTAFGISERANPEAWKDGKVTEEEARGIYEAKYVKGPRFDQVSDPHLQAQLIDFGVTSGPLVAIQKLQDILGVKPDGVLGPITLTALAKAQVDTVNNALVAARLRMICRIVQKNPSQVRFLYGWCDRALQWMV